MNVKTATRVLDMFEAFAGEARPLSLSELGRLLDIPVSSCFGLVRTLENRGYLYEFERRGGYYPTRRLQAMADRIAGADPVLERIEPLLMTLRDRCGETVLFGKLQAQGVVYLDVIESNQRIRYTASIGEFRPLHANSLAKAILGALEPQERDQVLDGYDWQRLTERTVTGREALEQDLDEARRRGWHANWGESVPDLAAVAWPVRLNRAWYAVSIAGPLQRMEPVLSELVNALRETCDAIERLG